MISNQIPSHSSSLKAADSFLMDDQESVRLSPQVQIHILMPLKSAQAFRYITHIIPVEESALLPRIDSFPLQPHILSSLTCLLRCLSISS